MEDLDVLKDGNMESHYRTHGEYIDFQAILAKIGRSRTKYAKKSIMHTLQYIVEV